jgi:uncharacterized membrane protein SpoIIM required for sporulation
MTEQAFVRRREASWKEFEGILRGGQRGIRTYAAGFPHFFRELTQDLNTARAHGFDPAIVGRLNLLVNEGNQLLYGQRGFSLKNFASFVFRSFPQKVRSRWRGIVAALLLFYGLALFFGFLCVRFPEMAPELVSESRLTSIEEMYDPEGENFLIPRQVSSDAERCGFYIYNNISIAFRTFAGGIFAGVGSLFLLCFNAVYLGVVTGHVINCGLGRTFFPFIIGHSSFELTALVFSAYGGLLLGYRFFVTRGLSRGASLRQAGRDALPIIAGSALMLLAAAAVEAFWSSRHLLPLPLRMGAGSGGWVLLLLYFLFAGREAGRRRGGQKPGRKDSDSL